jgi:hypothetical protein
MISSDLVPITSWGDNYYSNYAMPKFRNGSSDSNLRGASPRVRKNPFSLLITTCTACNRNYRMLVVNAE